MLPVKQKSVKSYTLTQTLKTFSLLNMMERSMSDLYVNVQLSDLESEGIYENVRSLDPDSNKKTFSASARNRKKTSWRCDIVFLGLLCLLLLVALIPLLCVYKVTIDSSAMKQNTLNNCTRERDQLQTSLTNITEERHKLQTSLTNVTEERDKLQNSLTKVTEERDKLQASLTTLTKERDQLQTNLTSLAYTLKNEE